MIKEQIKDEYMNGQDKVKHMTHRIKEHITCGHDDIKHIYDTSDEGTQSEWTSQNKT
jgi:hypothetical protein